MDFSQNTLILLPIALGLLGFIEPCTVGGHLLFLGTHEGRSRREKINATIMFVASRTLVTGLIGGLVALLGKRLIDAQTGIWLVFGLIFLVVGVAFIVGRAGSLKKQIDLAPAAWKRAQNPMLLGFTFGLNIPACAAPILFGLLGLAVTTGTLLAGFMMMALFGLALSLPLLMFAAVPSLASLLQLIGQKLAYKRWVLGAIFVLLGVWSIWFGLYVDPVDWSGQ